MAKEYKSYSLELAGRTLTVDIGRVAAQANGAALMHYGDTVVLSTATASEKPRDGIDFFPLSVEYEEKMYSVAKIPGGFNKREGKAAENAVLTCRVIDRPMRPLFPKDYRNDVLLDNLVLCVDQDASPELLAMLGSSLATCISDIPFDGPCTATQVGLIDGEFIINPTNAQKQVSDLALTVASTREKVIMIEAGANEVPEDVMIEAIYKAHEVNQTLIAFFDKIIAECGKEKHTYESYAVPEELFARIKELVPQEEMEEETITLSFSICNEEYERKERERAEFLRSGKEQFIPARYLTLEGDYLYAKAIKDYFTIPCALPDETVEREMEFVQILKKLARRDMKFSLQVWDWCLKNFLPFSIYDDYCERNLCKDVILELCDFPEGFTEQLVCYLKDHQEFLSEIICAGDEPVYGMSVLITAAIRGNALLVADVLFRSELKKAEGDWKETNKLAEDVIYECKDYEEVETIEYVRDNYLPLLAEVPDGSAYGLNPLFYQTEEEYLQAWEKQNKGWRRWDQNKEI